MRKPMLKMVLLIAFVLFTALSCQIFINSGSDPSDDIKGNWLLTYIGGAYFGAATYSFNGATVVFINNGNSTTYVMNGSIIVLGNSSTVGLGGGASYNTYSVKFSGNQMMWDIPGIYSAYYVFQKL